MNSRRYNNRVCTQNNSLSTHPSDDNLTSPNNNASIITSHINSLQNDGATGCIPCLGTSDGLTPSELCSLAFAENIGIDIAINEGIYVLTAPNGIILSDLRLRNAWRQFNSQLPTGSINGYFTSIFDNVGAALVSNGRTSLGIILGSIIVLIFILYTVICIVLIANSVIGPALGITLIFIGLLMSALIFMIVFYEVFKISTTIQTEFVSQIEPIFDNLGCALLSGICCYSGVSCCCPHGTGSTCENPPFPPSLSNNSLVSIN